MSIGAGVHRDVAPFPARPHARGPFFAIIEAACGDAALGVRAHGCAAAVPKMGHSMSLPDAPR
jgi:hypothetical protein